MILYFQTTCFFGGHPYNNSTMLTRFSGFPYGFDLLEGNVHAMDSPPTHELEMPSAQVGPFIQGSSCDPTFDMLPNSLIDSNVSLR
jgi:hypothetical protein